MFLTGKTGYSRHGQWSQGSFLALFSKTAGAEIRAAVRYTKMRQLGHFMVGEMRIKSDRACAANDRGPPTWNPDHYRPYVLDGEYRIFVEGTYGDNGLTVDVTKFPGLWEILHPLPVELTWMKWKDKAGWNGAGSEGPAIKQWGLDNIKRLRRPFMDEIEQLRKKEAGEINANPGSREALEAEHGQVWNSEEMLRDYEVVEFSAPYLVVKRKSDGLMGTLKFQHHPRFYWGFKSA